MAITRLSGGTTPPNGSDPRTFPAIWNDAVDDIEALELPITADRIADGAVSAPKLAKTAGAVMVFDDDAARTTAIPTPVEGMVTYLKDTDAVEKYDGSNFVNVDTGKILQVVSVNKTDDSFSTSSTTYLDVTGLSATITPSSTSSKILVMAQITYGGGNNSGGGHFKVVRGGSDVSYLGDVTGNSRVRNVFGGSDAGVTVEHQPAFRTWSNPITFVDSPNSTSALTYTVQTRNVDGFPVYVNRTYMNTNTTRNSIGASSITLIEVAG